MDKEKELARIADGIRRCSLCKIWGGGKAVPGEGNPDADIVFVGEAPGKEEAKTGRPFVGRSGKFLRQMIQEIGFDEKDVFITSPVQRRPLRGTPSKENIFHSRVHLLKQLSVIDPKIIVLMGNTACIALLDTKVELVRERGTIIQRDGRTYVLTFHPAYALRFSAGKKGFISDFGKLKRLVRGLLQ